MADVTWHDRTRSALERAREEQASLLQAFTAGHTRSKLISQGQRVAEYSLRAILYARGIRVPKTHELHATAHKWRVVLSDIWAELEPLLQHYRWLYPQRRLLTTSTRTRRPAKGTLERMTHPFQRRAWRGLWRQQTGFGNSQNVPSGAECAAEQGVAADEPRTTCPTHAKAERWRGSRLSARTVRLRPRRRFALFAWQRYRSESARRSLCGQRLALFSGGNAPGSPISSFGSSGNTLTSSEQTMRV